MATSALAPYRVSASGLAGGAADEFGLLPEWYKREPLRIVWAILRDIDGGTNGADLVAQAAAAGVTGLCITVGGSRAFYPTAIPFHERSSALPPGRDLVGEVAKAAREHNIRLIARFDFSKQPESTLRAHPEWFYKRMDGSFSNTRDRFRPCINSGFYHAQAPAIVAEAVQRYRPSLIFFNNFTNVTAVGEVAPCQCDNCKSAWDRLYPGKPFPTTFTAEYTYFIRGGTRVTAELIELPIRRTYPDIVLLNADSEPSDGLHTESRMAYAERQLWPYETTETVDRQLNSYPDKLSLNLCISYSHNLARLTLMPPAETRIRMYQAIASGSNPAYAMTGAFDQYDRSALDAAKDVWSWHKKNEDLYVEPRNAARILLLCRPSVAKRAREPAAESSERGLYQIVCEHHVPIASAETSEPLRRQPRQYDVVIVSRGAPIDGVEAYVRDGGTAIFVDQHPGLDFPRPNGSMKLDGAAYWRIRNRAYLPGFPEVDFVLAAGAPGDSQPRQRDRVLQAFSEPAEGFTLDLYPAEPNAALTLVPPMIENPAEQAASNMRDTEFPGLIIRRVGKGRIAFLPWDLGGLYNRFYFPGHAHLLMALLRHLQPDGTQIETDAPSTTETILMEQPAKRRKILHLVNLSGQTQRGYADPAMLGITRIALRGNFTKVESRALARDLPVTRKGGQTIVTLPSLFYYDALVFS
ncbi:MAG TPA: hypothetical protein VNT42_12935 [Sphingomonas sp.]|nr:hypothetical protein [Sphingomonas sp.]